MTNAAIPNPLHTTRCTLCDIPMNFAAAYVKGAKYAVCSFCVEAMTEMLAPAICAEGEPVAEALARVNAAAVESWRAAVATDEIVEVIDATPIGAPQ